MNILLVYPDTIPVKYYGGTERVIWHLGKELDKLGHKVTYLVKKGSWCNFASVIPIDRSKDIIDQIPEKTDVVHFHFYPANLQRIKKPYIITSHGNYRDCRKLDYNTVFVSKNQAERHGSESYIYNGLDWDVYQKPNLNNVRTFFHFLGLAAWRIKNVKGAINVVKGTKSETLKILGGYRFNIIMGLRLTLSTRVNFYGMVSEEKKSCFLNNSKGLIFPVRWHEPFGLSLIESLYFGCPVFGTPYGSLPEIVPKELGFLSNKKEELTTAILHAGEYSRKQCHDYAVAEFNSKKMALSYLEKYEKVLSNEKLHQVRPGLLVEQKSRFLDWE